MESLFFVAIVDGVCGWSLCCGEGSAPNSLRSSGRFNLDHDATLTDPACGRSSATSMANSSRLFGVPCRAVEYSILLTVS